MPLNSLSIKQMVFAIIALLASLFIFMSLTNYTTKSVDYEASMKADSIHLLLTVKKQYWTLLSVEGPFPSSTMQYSIVIQGKGESWDFRGQKGIYFDAASVQIANRKAFDFGYAWLDESKNTIYLNFYWISSPDRLIPSDIMGKYELKH